MTVRDAGAATGWDDVLSQRSEPLALVVEDEPPGHVVMRNRGVGRPGLTT